MYFVTKSSLTYMMSNGFLKYDIGRHICNTQPEEISHCTKNCITEESDAQWRKFSVKTVFEFLAGDQRSHDTKRKIEAVS